MPTFILHYAPLPKAEIVKPAAQGSMYLPTVEEVMARNAPVQTADLNASGQEGTGAEARLAENAPESYLDMAAEYANPIALDNIRRRLKAMCGGTLEIEPREQGGTRVTVFVPQNPPPGSIQCL